MSDIQPVEAPASNLVQPIAVVPGAHFETIAAVAIASNLAAAHADLDAEPWKAWLSRAFTKSVRRISKPADARLIAELSAAAPASRSFTVGGATAYAFAPMAYDDFPKRLRQLRVAGLDLERDGEGFRLKGPVHSGSAQTGQPQMLVSRDVDMTTGKTAAQVAHALMVWLIQLRAIDEATFLAWREHPHMAVCMGELDELSADPAHTITVVDSGLTEIAPKTATVRMNRWQ